MNVADQMNATSHSWVFSYGSNSISQLRARVENDNLIAYPGYIVDYDRIFCLRASPNWKGGACSIMPSNGSVVYGSVVLLTSGELRKLDYYEGGYTQQTISVKVSSPELHLYASSGLLPAIAYIANDPTFRVMPSECYLQAIRTHLLEHYASHPTALDIHIRALLPETTSLVHISTWTPPPVPALSLAALCVVVNAHRPTKWVMPITMRRICNAMESVGIVSTAQLAVYLSTTLTSSIDATCGTQVRTLALTDGTFAPRREYLHHLVLETVAHIVIESNSTKIMTNSGLIESNRRNDLRELIKLRSSDPGIVDVLDDTTMDLFHVLLMLP